MRYRDTMPIVVRFLLKMSKQLVGSDAAGIERDAARELQQRRRQAWARRPLSGVRVGQTRPSPGLEVPATNEPVLTIGGDHGRGARTEAEIRRVRSLSGPEWSVDAAALERQRIIRGWSRLELAGAAHVDPKTLRDLVGRRRRPNLGTVQAICTVLGLALADVIRFS
jgi:DNA-binding Xre family transcriptional regulator